MNFQFKIMNIRVLIKIVLFQSKNQIKINICLNIYNLKSFNILFKCLNSIF